MHDDPIESLTTNAPGFSELPCVERDAVMHFSLLWSLFEAKALNSSASADAISTLVQKWKLDGHLEVNPFVANLEYFRNRYFREGSPTQYLDGLHLRSTDKPDLVKAVISGNNNDLNDCIIVLLIVVYRIRNNLFHGMKWAYGLEGQLNNFNNANTVLIRALEFT